MSRRQQIAVAIGLLISAAFLWFAFRDLRPGDVIDSLSDVNFALLLLASCVYFIAVAVITLRWRFLLKAVAIIPMKKLFPLVCIGYMGNNVYPFRSGEALRIYLLRRNHQVPIVRATTTVLVERIFDGIVMLTFVILALLLTDITSDDIQRVIYIAAPLFFTALIVFFGLAAQPNLLRRFVQIIERALPSRLRTLVDKLAEEVLLGLEGLRTPADLAGAVITSYLTWSVEAGVYWIVAFSFGLELSYVVMLLTVGVVNLAGLLPASPGQIGVFEFFVSVVLVGAGIEAVQAAAYALVVHVVIWLPVTIAGFAFLVRQGLSLSAISQAHDISTPSPIDPSV